MNFKIPAETIVSVLARKKNFSFQKLLDEEQLTAFIDKVLLQ